VIAAAPNDYHTIGLICFGITLHRLGWRVVCLGPATPVEMMLEAALATQARCVCISTTVAGLEPHVNAVRAMSETVPTAIGGPAADARLAEDCGASYLSDAVSGAGTMALEGM
jgi:methanogenic corrinoid protein MtbC1